MNVWQTKHYLRLWQGFAELSGELTEWDTKAATIFFNALKKLDKDDVAFLADKYVTHVRKRVVSPVYGKPFSSEPATDKTMAELNEMDTLSYTRKRVKIEAKFQVAFNEIAKVYDKKRLDNLPEFNLIMGKLFLKSYEPTPLGCLRDELVFTVDPAQAKVFQQGDREAATLIRSLKLEKWEPNPDKWFATIYFDDE